MSEIIAQFVAVIPDLQSALTISGQGGARLKLDVPESEFPEVVKLIAFGREKALMVTVAEAEG